MHRDASATVNGIAEKFESQGAYTLAEIVELAASRDIELRLARVKTKVKDLLQRDGVIDRLGEGRKYGNVYRTQLGIARPKTRTSQRQVPGS